MENQLPYETPATEAFAVFVKTIEPKFRYSLCASLGSQIGFEDTADALAYGWAHWDEVSAMDNPAGRLSNGVHVCGRRPPGNTL